LTQALSSLPYSVRLKLFAYAIVGLSIAYPDQGFSKTAGIQDRLPYEVRISGQWNSKPLEITRILSCDMKRRMAPGNITTPDEALKVRDVWESNGDRISHRLPNGEVLIFRVPHMCNTFSKSLMPLPHGYLPATYWIDNRLNPDMAEEVTYINYFSNVSRRFVIQEFSMSAVLPTTEVQGESADVDLFHTRIPRHDLYFAGLQATAFPQFVWQRYPELVAALKKLGRAGPVSRETLRRTAPDLLSSCSGPEQGIGRSERCLIGRFDTRPYAIAMRLHDGIWKPLYGESGVRRFTARAIPAGVSSKGCSWSVAECDVRQGTYRVEVDNYLHEYSMKEGGALYDAKNGMVIVFGIGVFAGTKGN
jgi:hypothetical protein